MLYMHAEPSPQSAAALDIPNSCRLPYPKIVCVTIVSFFKITLPKFSVLSAIRDSQNTRIGKNAEIKNHCIYNLKQ